MKVIFLAYACEPNRTSEPGVGWRLPGALAATNEITVVTRSNNRAVIEKYLAANPEAPQCAVRYEYHDLSPILAKAKKVLPFGAQWYQALWHGSVAREYRMRFEDYDVVHHLTFGSPFFSPHAARYARRMVWGPIGGSQGIIPWAFLRREKPLAVIRELLYWWMSRRAVNPGRNVRRLRDKCCAILFRSSDVRRAIGVCEGQRGGVVCETAYEEPVREKAFDLKLRPLNVVCVSRLIPHKGVRYAIEGFARFVHDGGKGRFAICGEGPLEGELKEFARKLKVDGLMDFKGQIEHDKVLEELKAADVMLHTSFREGGSWSLLEGMAHSLPVICQDRSGMADMVADGCGIRIAADTPEELVNGVKDALFAYLRDPSLVALHGRAAAHRAACDYTWKGKAQTINEIYKG